MKAEQLKVSIEALLTSTFSILHILSIPYIDLRQCRATLDGASDSSRNASREVSTNIKDDCHREHWCFSGNHASTIMLMFVDC